MCYEASCGYGHYHDVLTPLAPRVLLAHRQLRLIFRSKHKNDRNDAERVLARRSTTPQRKGDVMPGLDVGDHVTDLTFLRPEGTAVRLSEFPGPLLLIFLRHLR